MHAAVIPIGLSPKTNHATWSLLEVTLPGAKPVPFGILLVEDSTGRLTLRLRDRSALCDPDLPDLEEDEADILDFLESDLLTKAAESGGRSLLDSLEDSLSHFLRITDRTAIACGADPQKTADRIFDEYVDSEVRPFVTHLPLYSLRAAATRFGEGMQSEQEGWLRVPHPARRDNMFVARVVGRSMEPLIPDGSLCVFRAGVAGTRQGKLLLIEKFGETDFAGRYTIKRYTSRKRRPPSDESEAAWEHESIRLEPLNREFPAFDLGPEDFRVIAEFVEVLG